jgi:hypothetical protein
MLNGQGGGNVGSQADKKCFDLVSSHPLTTDNSLQALDRQSVVCGRQTMSAARANEALIRNWRDSENCGQSKLKTETPWP